MDQRQILALQVVNVTEQFGLRVMGIEDGVLQEL